MKEQQNMPAQRVACRPNRGLDSLSTIEKTQQNLWALALVLFLLVTLSLLAIDLTSAAAERLIFSTTNGGRLPLAHFGAALTLLISVVLICGYFYGKLLEVRNQNRELVRALDASAGMLALRSHQLSTWDRLSHQLITNFNLPRLLELIARTAAGVTDSDCAAIIVSDRDSPHLRLAAIHHGGLQTDLARRVAAKVIATGEPVEISPDSVPGEFDRPDLAWETLIALAAAPLAAADTIKGSLLVGRVEPGEPFPENLMEILGSFANQASLALEQAHLYAESQRQLETLRKLLQELRLAQSRLEDSSSVRGSDDPIVPDTETTHSASVRRTALPS